MGRWVAARGLQSGRFARRRPGDRGAPIESNQYSGRIAVDAHGFTGRAKWYAGGDCVNGGKEVVNAAAEGKAAALAIHASLSGGANHA